MSIIRSEVTVLVIGAGSRGAGYSQLASVVGARIVGVAEPRATHRERMATAYSIPAEHVFQDWKDAAALEKFADCVFICTQDGMHEAPSIAFAKLKYHILLEKPMAPTKSACIRIAASAKASGVIFCVCHVLRYTEYTKKLKAMVDSGIIGSIVSVDHLEPVGFWHQAHSFVRGNWRNEEQSSFMLLAKSCHDMDWLRHIIAAPCRKVQSFGSLKHFRKDQKPKEAKEAMRCLHCDYEPSCPYSAKKIYLRDRLLKGRDGWPVSILHPNPSIETITEALESGPYGRCVYECDNDVVDHQTVNMLFDGDVTATFTMTAFNQIGGRRSRIFGTLGSLEGDGEHTIIHTDFLTNAVETLDTKATAPTSAAGSGHFGGDEGLVTAFIQAVREGNGTEHVLSGPEESLETHLMTFAAEQSRHSGCVVDIEDLFHGTDD